jgi:nucleoside-diphosphate-sugar epimerase
MRALVTGGSGTVGSALLGSLCAGADWEVRAAVRSSPAVPVANCDYVVTGDLGAAGAELSGVATDCEVVIHTAARVHVMGKDASGSADAYRQTNVEGTLRVAREAARSGVRRFIFISSIKVNGERTAAGRAFAENDRPHPEGAYALSKWEAELGLQALCAQTGMEYVIVRPPLVYGPGVRANFLALASAVKRGAPLPFGSIRNQRSFVGIDNLVDFIRLCMRHPAAANQTFLVSDGQDLSTPDLVRAIAAALERPPRLLPVPVWLLRGAGLVTARQAAVQRLLENLQVDIGKARRQLGWRPPVAVQEGLRRCVHGMDGP